MKDARAAQQRLDRLLAEVSEQARYDHAREVEALVLAGADPFRHRDIDTILVLAHGVLTARPLLDAIAPRPWTRSPSVGRGADRRPLLNHLLARDSARKTFSFMLDWWVRKTDPRALQSFTADLNYCAKLALATATSPDQVQRALQATHRLLCAGVVADATTLTLLRGDAGRGDRGSTLIRSSMCAVMAGSGVFTDWDETLGRTPLGGERRAARATFARMAALGLAVDDPDPLDGETPLAKAMLAGNYQVAQALLDCGADPARQVGGTTPMGIGLDTQNEATVVDDDLVEILDRMRAHGARAAAQRALTSARSPRTPSRAAAP